MRPESPASRTADDQIVWKSAAPAAVPPLRPRVEIAMRDPSDEDDLRQTLRNRGRHLARQDAWDTLAAEIEAADRARLMTTGLMPQAELLAQGARADVVQAAHAAIMRGEPRQASAALTAFQANLEDLPDSAALGYVVGAAHVDAARVWRGASQPDVLSPQRRGGWLRHMQAAARLAERFDPFETDSALMAQLRCAVLDVDPAPAQRVEDDYEDLIDLEPRCPDHMRALGRDLLPRRYGTFERLDAQARRTAHRTRDIWGMGGYAWIWLGAMETDPQAQRRADAGLFREGLRDILDRFGDQHMVNRLAAFTGVTLPSGGEVDDPAMRLSAEFDWIAGERLAELHPRVWADAAAPGRAVSTTAEPEPGSLVMIGKARALSTLAERFAPEMGRSGQLTFGDGGLLRT
ncbi:hypothetical protein [Thetidibacter halocola]|uniref:Uncharacterized protein n=1 Tax=Thetidibacter halocola TaxID=2827239 RepID=A0A8J7WB11_9RHOB|nr:hypothetical protein [Thetidibacter halocola]MBS0123164.1 hypothetical protein [Thetidibacter halocola]